MRRATVATRPARPSVVAAAVRPDDTADIDTRVDGGRVVADIDREDTGGLRTTVDDYIVNLRVAADVVQIADRHTHDT